MPTSAVRCRELRVGTMALHIFIARTQSPAISMLRWMQTKDRNTTVKPIGVETLKRPVNGLGLLQCLGCAEPATHPSPLKEDRSVEKCTNNAYCTCFSH